MKASLPFCTVVLHNVPSAGKSVLLGQRYHICPWFVKQKLSAKKNLPVRPLRLASILPDLINKSVSNDREAFTMPFTPKLTYKGKPLVRKDNELYYGRMTDP